MTAQNANPLTYIVTTTILGDDNKTRTEFAPDVPFTVLTEALEHATSEVHGVATAQYTVTTRCNQKQACSQVMASRNRVIRLYLQTHPAMPGTYVELKAPQVCKLLQVLGADDSEYEVVYTATELTVHEVQIAE